MKHLKLSIIGLILLTLTPLTFANPTLVIKAVEQFVKTLAALENLRIKGDLDDIKKGQLIDLMGDMRGVITTLSETSNFTESSRQERVYENSLIPLNQSLEISYSLAEMLLEDRKVTAATPLISIYGQLATLKKQVLVELGQASVADSFQQDSDQKLSSLQEAKKEVCYSISSAKTKATVAVTIASTVCAVSVAAGGGVFSWITGPVGCALATLPFVAVDVAETVFTDEECKKLGSDAMWLIAPYQKLQ